MNLEPEMEAVRRASNGSNNGVHNKYMTKERIENMSSRDKTSRESLIHKCSSEKNDPPGILSVDLTPNMKTRCSTNRTSSRVSSSTPKDRKKSTTKRAGSKEEHGSRGNYRRKSSTSSRKLHEEERNASMNVEDSVAIHAAVAKLSAKTSPKHSLRSTSNSDEIDQKMKFLVRRGDSFVILEGNGRNLSIDKKSKSSKKEEKAKSGHRRKKSEDDGSSVVSWIRQGKETSKNTDVPSVVTDTTQSCTTSTTEVQTSLSFEKSPVRSNIKALAVTEHTPNSGYVGDRRKAMLAAARSKSTRHLLDEPSIDKRKAMLVVRSKSTRDILEAAISKREASPNGIRRSSRFSLAVVVPQSHKASKKSNDFPDIKFEHGNNGNRSFSDTKQKKQDLGSIVEEIQSNLVFRKKACHNSISFGSTLVPSPYAKRDTFEMDDSLDTDSFHLASRPSDFPDKANNSVRLGDSAWFLQE